MYSEQKCQNVIILNEKPEEKSHLLSPRQMYAHTPHVHHLVFTECAFK